VSVRPIAAGEVVLSEEPTIAVSQESSVPTLADLQMWVVVFAAQEPESRSKILGLHCPETAAEGGSLASLLGVRGERTSECLKCPAGVAEHDVWRFLRIMECNCLESRAGGGVSVELSDQLSRLNHSCSPNILRGPGKLPWTLEARALRPIAAGEELTVSYVDAESLWKPTSERRELLRKRWQFVCNCERCAAPDRTRAFACPAGPACGSGGVVYAAPDGGFAPCGRCGRRLSAVAASAALAAEERLRGAAPEAVRDAEAVASSLGAALETRNAADFQKASSDAMKALGKCVAAATSSKEVAPAHHLVMGIAKAAATVRTVLGDSLQAGGREELAVDMWQRAAGELAGVVDVEHAILPMPHEGRIMDLVGLGGIHQRMGQNSDARRYLSEAVDGMRAVHWASPPGSRASNEALRRGVEAAVAQLAGELEDDAQ